MFVPRALRLKGVKETQKPKRPQPAKASTKHTTLSKDDALVTAMQNTSTTSPASQDEQTEPKIATRGSKFTTTPVTPQYIAQLAAGVELIFTDYAHQHPESAKWLQGRYRTLDGEENFIHLTALLQHTNIASLRPEATQVGLRQAIQERCTSNLQLSENGFYVRRRPSTYPLSFVPQDSFSIVDDEGVSFWDQRTIYVEPHIRHLCKTPAKVSHWLQEHGQIKAKWLPVQAVETLYNSCGFVVLSGNVMHEDAWKKWRVAEKPTDWKIMTKAEHTKRTNEYLDLLSKSRTGPKRKYNATTPIGDADTGDAGDAAEVDAPAEVSSTTKRKKRKRTKNKTANDFQKREHADMAGDSASKADEGHENKRRV